MGIGDDNGPESTLMLPDEYRRMREAEDGHWWYRALRRWLRNALRAHVPRGCRVLDSGCGTGANLRLLDRLGYVATGHDVFPAALEMCRNRGVSGRLCVASAAALPFPDGSFDAILSMDVLYLLPLDAERTALEEFRRVLRPGGTLLLNLPAYDWLRGRHDQAIAAKRRYTRATLRQKLIAAGFQAERMEYRLAAFLPAVALVRRLLRPATNTAEPARSDLALPMGPVNGFLSALSQMEECLGAALPRPFGTSVCAVARATGAPGEGRFITLDKE